MSEEIEDPAYSDPPPAVRHYAVAICDPCARLEGTMCHTPGCVFIRFNMVEAGVLLDQLMLRPVVGGERMAMPEPIDEALAALPATERRDG